MIELSTPAEAPTCGSSGPVCVSPMTPDQAADLASVFKVLSDPVRLRIASIVACCPGGEVCMGDIASEFDVSGPTVSHHLRKLREAGVLAAERRANEVYYRVVPERLGGILGRLAMVGLAEAQA